MKVSLMTMLISKRVFKLACLFLMTLQLCALVTSQQNPRPGEIIKNPPPPKKKKKPEEFVPPPLPDFEDLEKKEPSRVTSDPNFAKAVESMSGYYLDPSKNPSLKKTILIVGVNSGYKDFFHNFKCHASRLGLKFLPISLDEGIYSYLTSIGVTTYLMKDIPGRDRVASEPSRFGGKNFNLIGCRKMEAVAGALSLGYDVIFSDVDIAILRDPLPYLFLDGVDYTHSTNKGCNVKWDFNETMEGNTGFYAVKSNPQTIRTWDLVYRACARAPLYDDQTMFWLILRHNRNPPPYPLIKCPRPGVSAVLDSSVTSSVYSSGNLASVSTQRIVTCPLDDCLFSAGHLKDYNGFTRLIRILNMRHDKAVMVHANWLSGKENKKDAMNRHGVWIARRVTDQQMQMRASSGDGRTGAPPPMKKLKGNWSCLEPHGELVQ